MTAAWEQRPDESDRAFEAFVVYRDMGPRRSTREVAQELNKSASLIGRWSAKHEWPSRVTAWDRQQDRMRQEAQLETTVEVSRRQAAVVQRQIAALDAVAVELANRISENPDALRMIDTEDLISLLPKTARSMSLLISAQREIHGFSDDSRSDMVRSEVAAMSRPELEAYLTRIDPVLSG